ncbi:MAG: arylsulfatase [Cyclobacteriaceae bacterium]
MGKYMAITSVFQQKCRTGFRLLILTAFGLLACFSCEQGKKEAIKGKPNIIYILADDLGYGDLSFTGQQKFQTPNIDLLAKEGMFFSQHYSGSTVCAPSRSALLTGQHTGHTFIRGNKKIMPEGQYPIDSAVVTLAEKLSEAGYVTGAFGKWGLGAPSSEGDPLKQGFDEFYGYNCQRFAHSYYPYHLWDGDTKVVLDSNKGFKKGQYAPYLIHDKALQFLEENKDEPFFMFYPSVIPHAELAIPNEYLTKYQGKLLPEKSFVGKEDSSNYKKGAYGSQLYTHAAFAAMMHLLDEQVGEIRRKVEELGIAENTMIIFTSDNGPHKEGGADPVYFNSNGQYRGFKRDLYEGGIRVPMMAYWPGTINAGHVSDHISAFWDFLPTACEIAKIGIPDSIDGISFLPELLGQEQPKHDYLYWEFHEGGGKQAVRLGDWKAVRLKMGDNPKAPMALFNLMSDPEEQVDIAKKHPEIIAQMDAIMINEHLTSEVFRFPFEMKKDTL